MGLLSRLSHWVNSVVGSIGFIGSVESTGRWVNVCVGCVGSQLNSWASGQIQRGKSVESRFIKKCFGAFSELWPSV